MRLRFMAPLLLLASSLLAQEPAPVPVRASTLDNPRPGMKWMEVKPGGAAPLTLVDGTREVSYWEIAPGGEVQLPVMGPNQRLLVQVRPLFAARTDAEVEYSFLWTMDGGPEAKSGHRSKPHPTATWKDRTDAVPGMQDLLLVDVPAEGTHMMVFRWAAKRRHPVAMRFLVEVPRPPSDVVKAAKEKHDDHWWMSILNRIEFGYSDNVWNFSDENVHGLEEYNTSHPSDKFDKVESNEDAWLKSTLDARIFSPLTALGRFTIGGRIEDTLYIENRRKNYDEFGIYLRHSPVPKLEYGVFGNWAPDIFFRNLDSRDISGDGRQHAHYDRYEMGAQVRYRWSGAVSTTFRYTWELRDWNSKFNEKDSFRDHWELDLRLEPASWLDVNIDLEYVHGSARALGDDRDASFHSYEPGIEVVVKTERLHFGVEYEFDGRSYTTSNSREIDPTHKSRHDRTHTWTGSVKLITGESSFLKLSYYRIKKTCSLPGRESSADASDLDDNYERDVNGFEFAWEFRFP